MKPLHKVAKEVSLSLTEVQKRAVVGFLRSNTEYKIRLIIRSHSKHIQFSRRDRNIWSDMDRVDLDYYGHLANGVAFTFDMISEVINNNG